MKCVIIAAGRGSRFRQRRESKPLTPVNDKPLIDWVISAAAEAGLGEFVVVTGYAREKLEPFLDKLAREKGISLSYVYNEQWEKENGLSVSKARDSAGEKFVLLMSDHIFEPAVLRRLMAEPIEPDETVLAVDFDVHGNASVDLGDVTKVLVEDGKIARIGKTIIPYNAFDTGMFLCTAELFRALDESQAAGDSSLSGGLNVLIASGKARVMDIQGGFWIDVDDEQALERAERLLARRG